MTSISFGRQVEDNNLDGLMDSISQLQEIDAGIVQAVAQELSDAQIPYKYAYKDYQSGGWGTFMLYNPSGNSEQDVISDGKAVPTEIMGRLPLTAQLLESLGLEYFSVRVAKTAPNSYLWEHCDYVELGADNKLRLHIPIVSNPNAIMQFDKHAVHMGAGYLWKLNPSVSHAISNTGTEDRTHLILDCYINDNLRDMLSSEFLQADLVAALPAMTPEIRREILAKAKEHIEKNGIQYAEDALLKSFHQYDLGSETSYDLLAAFYGNIGFPERQRYWLQQGIERMVVREKVDSSKDRVNLRGVFSQARHNTPELAQYRILKDMLHTCRAIPGLDRAYVRGSLARGDADPYSDIDLLCVVSPDKFESFVEESRALIAKNHKALFPGWVDTIVKDFGGIGFVYLIEREGRIFQLDLYIACNGHRNLERLEKVAGKQEIFHRQHDRKDAFGLAAKRYQIHADQVQDYIDEECTHESDLQTKIVELSVLGFMIKKCLLRGDPFVAASEFLMWKKTLVELLREKFDPELKGYGFYHVKRLKDLAGDNGNLFKDLETINSATLTHDNFVKMHNYAIALIQINFPEEFSRNCAALAKLSQHITGNSLGIERVLEWGHGDMGALTAPQVP